MKDDTIAALRQWAETFAVCGLLQAVQCRELLAQYDSTSAALATALAQVEDYVELLRVKDALIDALMNRVKVQAEILSRRAEAEPISVPSVGHGA